jgi:uncharacterized protein YdhG (YjbR/CyaY superfamily)
MRKFNSVDEYIFSTPLEAGQILEEPRQIIKSALPEDTEKIWYGVPFYFYHGELAGIDAASKHVALGL